jgi:hypothetical protein
MSGIFRNGPKPVINVLGGMRVQTSLQGLPIALIYGRTRSAGNLVDYDDFIARPVTGGKKGSGGGGSGKKGGGQFDYGAAIIMGLCQGPITRVGAIWSTQGNLPVNQTSETYTVPPGGGSYTATQAATYLEDLGVTRGDSYSITANDFGSPGTVVLTGVQDTPMLFGGSGAGHYTRSGAVYTFGTADSGKTMTITYAYAPPVSAGGTAQDPIVTVGFTFFNGAFGQAAWSYMTSKHPAKALGYSGLAYVATPEFDLGMSGTLPNLSFEIYGKLPFGSGAGDSNPSDVLYDLLTNSIYGCGIDPSFIGSMTQYSNYCLANGFLISPALDTVRTAADWVKDILDATNSDIIESGGQLVVLPRGDTTVVANGVTFSPATQPIYDLTVDDFLRDGSSPAVQVERPTVQDAYNSVKVEYLDRANAYNPSVVEAQDLQAIDAYKYRPEGTRQYHMFTTQPAAAKCAATALARLVYIRNKFKFKLAQKYILLDPMDLVTLTVPEIGFSMKPVRIVSIDEQPDRTLDIEAEEFPFGCSGPTLYPKQSQTPGGPNAYAPPGSVNAPIIFEALSRLNNQIGHNIWFGLSGTNPNWGGCRIWVSLDGITYKQAATAIGATKMGVLTANLASHADPDTADTLSVNLTESAGILQGFTSAECDVFASLCYVDGELIAYQDATLTSAFHFDLATKLRRGVYGSTIGAHSIGANFMFLDDTVEGWNYDLALIGKTIFFKFTSFNRSGLVEELLSDVTAYPYTVTGASIGLLTPAHASYRPLTNPLTAHDAGSSVTINVASFSMRVPGMNDLPFGSGAISGLSYNTLYYVYFSDPGFLPESAPTYLASTVKEDAIDAAGYLYVGSILTPVVGAPDTSGNNDGGGGAQLGNVAALNFAGSVSSGTHGTGVVTNPTAVLGDGTSSLFASMAVTGNGALNAAIIQVNGAPGYSSPGFKELNLCFDMSVSDNLSIVGTGSEWSVQIAWNNPITGAGGIFYKTLAGTSSIARQIITTPLPPDTNLSQIVISIGADSFTDQVSGTATIKVWRVFAQGVI